MRIHQSLGILLAHSPPLHRIGNKAPGSGHIPLKLPLPLILQGFQSLLVRLPLGGKQGITHLGDEGAGGLGSNPVSLGMGGNHGAGLIRPGKRFAQFQNILVTGISTLRRLARTRNVLLRKIKRIRLIGGGILVSNLCSGRISSLPGRRLIASLRILGRHLGRGGGALGRLVIICCRLSASCIRRFRITQHGHSHRDDMVHNFNYWWLWNYLQSASWIAPVPAT